jgi:hypothetical protein
MFKEKVIKVFEKIKKYSFLIGIFYLIYFMSVYYNVCDWDLWARLAVGSIFFQTGKVLPHDVFAYTLTKPLWVDHEWGSGVVFYFLTSHFGDAGLLLFKFFIILFIWFFVFKTIETHSNQATKPIHQDPYRIGYYLLMLYAILPAFTSNVRSHCFTYFFFAMWLYMLELVRQGNAKKRIYICFALTMLLWANVHGGFIAGLGIAAAYGLGEFITKRKWKEYLWILIPSTLVTLINPYGFKYWSFLFSAVSMNRPYIQEWWPLNPLGPVSQFSGFKIFFIATIIAFVYAFIKKRDTVKWCEVFVLIITAYMSFKHVRHIIFFIIASASYIYYYIYPALDWMSFSIVEKFTNLFNPKIKIVAKWLKEIAVYSLIFLFGVVVYIICPLKLNVKMERFPTRAVKMIQINHLDGNLLVLFNWGSYALWKLYPKDLVAVDGRYEEVYPNSTIEDIANFHYQQGYWKALLDKYHTDFMLIPLEYKALYAKLLTLENWKVIYKDDRAAIFAPKTFHKKLIPVSDKFDANKEKYESMINTSFLKNKAQ